jgi:DNA replication licensing factor MCM7
LPAALLSRFDLLFLLLDRADFARDNALAQHVAYVHQHRSHPTPLASAAFASSPFLRWGRERGVECVMCVPRSAYIARARQYSPVIPRALTDFIANAYAVSTRCAHLTCRCRFVSLRGDEALEAEKTGAFT